MKRLSLLLFVAFALPLLAGEPLASWNDGPARQAVLNFVHATTDASSSQFVPQADRIATFDQDGTLWVEHPTYVQVLYCMDRLAARAAKNAELKDVEPLKTILSRNREALAKLVPKEVNEIAMATLSCMSVDEFSADVKDWLATAKDTRWNRPFGELTYQPMQEVLQYLRANGYRTYIVTGAGQDFVRAYAEQTYGIPPEQVVGTTNGTQYGYGKDGKPYLANKPNLLIDANGAGKSEGIHLVIGRRPHAAVGNSTGDQQMLEYTKAGDGARLAMLLLHDDAAREYAYGPAQGLESTGVGTFTQALYDEAIKNDWTVVSMKKDWKCVFAFDSKAKE